MPKPDTQGETILDFSGVKPFEPPDSGLTYLARVSANVRGKGPAGPTSAVEFTILAPEEVPVEEWIQDDTVEGGYKKGDGIVLDDHEAPVMTKASGRKLFRNFSHASQALPFLHEFIRGVDPEAELNETFKYREENYVGLQCAVKITNEAYDEQVRPRVKKILPASAYKG